MSVYRPAKSPYWHYDFQLEGVRFHGTTGTTSKADAKKIEEKKRRLAAMGTTEAKRMTLRAAFARYWEEHGKHQKASGDLWGKMVRAIDDYGPDRLLTDLSNDFIATVIARRRGQVSDGSVNRETTVLRAVLNRAATVWEIPFKMPNWDAHFLIEPLPRTRHLTDDEEARLFAALRPDFWPLVRFCLLTGARVTSARTLTWDRVFDDRVVLRPKSRFKNDELSIPMVPELRAILEPCRGQHAIFVFTYLCQAHNVVRRKPGQRYPFARDGWRRTWASALRRAGIKDFRFHDLRHTAGTQMLKATGDIAAVQQVLGHADIASTMRYAHVLDGAKRSALSRNSPGDRFTQDVKPAFSVVKSK